jgi:TetR/AcrR family transcriptional repressor of mexJK operon
MAMAWPCPKPKSFLSQATISPAFTPGLSKPFFSAIFLKSSGVLPVFVWMLSMARQTSVESGLIVLARRFIAALMQPRILRLRRLVIANADRFPDVGRSWYEQGFERVLSTLAISFQGLADRKLLHVDDPLLVANHFVGMLLWIPINKAVFTGDRRSSPDELERTAVTVVRAFLAGYGSTSRLVPRSAQAAGRKTV